MSTQCCLSQVITLTDWVTESQPQHQRQVDDSNPLTWQKDWLQLGEFRHSKLALSPESANQLCHCQIRCHCHCVSQFRYRRSPGPRPIPFVQTVQSLRFTTFVILRNTVEIIATTFPSHGTCRNFKNGIANRPKWSIAKSKHEVHYSLTAVRHQF